MGKEKVHKGDSVKCLICGDTVLQRQLCSFHYGQFRRRKESLKTKEKRKAYDDWAVEKGLIGDDARNSDDPFAEALEEFLANDPIAAADVNEGKRVQLEAEENEDESPKPSRKRSRRHG
jgi:hypothetical protein